MKNFTATFKRWIESEKVAVKFEKLNSTFGTWRQNFQLLPERILHRAEPVRLQAGCREHRYLLDTLASCDDFAK
jgi:hypothetical protein